MLTLGIHAHTLGLTAVIFGYDPALTPTVASILPTRGSSEGGTIITITGSGFTAAATAITVTLDDIPCTDLTKISATQLTCTTSKPTVKTGLARSVRVHTSGIGYAATKATYQFVDLWSRHTTWGGGPLPVEGDSIVIPANTTVLLDVPADQLPKLHTIILLGNLRFDNSTSAMDLHLQARALSNVSLFSCCPA